MHAWRRKEPVEIFPGISVDPEVRFGESCLVGTRVDVATVVADVACGESFLAVQKAYELSREQVVAALRYAAHLVAQQRPSGAVFG